MDDTPKIYAAICGVMNDIKAVDKNKKSTQGFNYRGVDDVMNAVQPAFIKNKVFVVPTVLEESKEEKTTTKGSVVIYAKLKMDYKFYAEDGSNITATVLGEAMDSGDKAISKAMSIAYKYALFQVLSIPTEEMKDPDAEGHDDLVPDCIDEIKLKVLKDKMNQKGVHATAWNGVNLEKLSTLQFTEAMNVLEKMEDSKTKQSNLDL